MFPLFVVAACTTETTDDNDVPPIWDDAPSETQSLGEGQTLKIPVMASDPDGGEVKISATAAAGMDAEVVGDELRIHAGYGAVAGPTIVTITDDEDNAVDFDVAVDVAPIGWVDHQEWTTADGPEEREHATVLFHEESGQAFMFGGSGYHPQFVQMMDDFWRYDVATGAWTQITPTGDIPAAAGSRRFAGAWGSGEGMLFGGYGADNATLNELYRVKVEGDTLAFKLIEPVDLVAPVRSLHGFVYDPETERYFAFGGIWTMPLADTWMMELEGDKARWTQLELAAAPSPRYGFFFGFDADAGRMILFSGAQGTASLNPANDTWALDVRSDPPAWIWLGDDTTGGPPGRRNGCHIWDPSGPRLVVFGGTPDAMNTAMGLYAFDARPGHEAWSTLALENEPPVRSSGFGFADGSRIYLGFGNSNAIYRDWGILGY